VTGDLGGGDGCTGRASFYGVLDPGTSCAVAAPFHAKAVGLPPVTRAEAGPGVLGTAAPVLLYDADGNVVGSEQAQFLTAAPDQNRSALADCNTPEGLTRAMWSDTVELFAGHR
jgi:hypothetical protein